MPLSSAEIEAAAVLIGASPCAVKAVVEVESSGSGFLPDGRPKILFEGHVFWQELEKRGMNPELLHMPDVLYPKWDKSKYKGGAAEHDRLKAAALVNQEAALCSASWGLFQIMGFNFRYCGFSSVENFVKAQEKSEADQLRSFCAYMQSTRLVPYLERMDWAGFARRYNGSGYAANKYDERLKAAYEKCRKGRA